MMGFRIIEDASLIDRKQNRTHRKRRINKKWAKRYGFTETPKREIFRVGDFLLVHPLVAKALREGTSRQ